jgi:DNA polymerase II small subunit
MNPEEKKQRIREIAKRFAEKGLLLSPALLEMEIKKEEEGGGSEQISKIIEGAKGKDMLVPDEESLSMLEKNKDINWTDFEKAKTSVEKNNDSRMYDKFVEYAKKEEPEKAGEGNGCKDANDKNRVIIVNSYQDVSKKRNVQDFVDFFNARYRALEAMLRNRQELSNLMSISRIKKRKDREEVSLIGMVSEKNISKNGNIILSLEDPTGITSVLFNKTKKELFSLASDTVVDEVIGVFGIASNNIVFANSMCRPDIPAAAEKKSSPEEGYAIFLSDFHVGSKNFLNDEFSRFLKWINGESGSDAQKNIASKVKYIFVVGDLIDGVGIYNDQDQDLLTKDVYEQYSQCAELLSKIPNHMKIIICPGNHDAMRIAEPQPVLYPDFASGIWKLPNAVMVTNPAVVNIDSSENFSGFDVLMYHGYSFDYYASDVESIRVNGGYDRADLIMKFLLQRRHLAPATSSTLFIPDPEKDPLVITKVPDIFVTGHIHKCSASVFKNIALIGGSCWQSKTAFQERVGHHPLPARVPIMNLKTREIKILNFELQEKKQAADASGAEAKEEAKANA